MPNYVAKIRIKNQISTLRIIADNLDDAKRQAAKSGRIVSVSRKRSLTPSRGMKDDDRIIFLRRLSTMVRSRLGMGESLKIMKEAFNGPISRVSDELYKRIEAGENFGDCIMKLPKDFPDTTAALIRSGIQGGDLYTALNDAATYEAEMSRINRDSSKGLWSALSSFGIAAGIILGTSFYLAPYVMESDLIRAAGDAVDIDWVFFAADIVAYVMLFIVTVFAAILFLGTGVKKIAPSFADRLILKIPVYRDLVLSQKNYTVFYGMSLLTASGVRMEDTLRLSRESAPKGEVAEDLNRALIAVRNGKSWPQAMKNLHPTDRAALSTSQDRVQISQSLDAIAVQYKESYTRRVQQVVPALQAVAAVFMAIGGGLIFAMIILPMLMMTRGIL